MLFLIFSILIFASCERNDDRNTTSESNISSDNNIRPTFNIQIPPDPTTTQIPLEYDGLMSTVECKINGMACRMILDTGSETIGLFENKLEKFNLKTIGTIQTGYTAGGVTAHHAISEFVIEFPDDIKVMAKNCAVLPQFQDKPNIDGIIGGPVFVTLKATIDYDKKILTLKTLGAIQSVDNNE